MENVIKMSLFFLMLLIPGTFIAMEQKFPEQIKSKAEEIRYIQPEDTEKPIEISKNLFNTLVSQSGVIKATLEDYPDLGLSKENPAYIPVTKGEFNLLKLYILNPYRSMPTSLPAITRITALMDKLNMQQYRDILTRASDNIIVEFTNPDYLNKILFYPPSLLRALSLSPDLQEHAAKKILMLPLFSNLWARTLTLERSITTERIYAFAFTADNTKIIAGSNTAIYIWDVDTGKIVKNIRVNKPVLSLAITSDGAKIIVGLLNNIQVWDLNTGTLLQTINNQSDMGNLVAITSDSSKIIAGTVNILNPTTIKIWDLNSGALLNTITTEMTRLTKLSVLAPSNQLMAADLIGSITLWDLYSLSELHATDTDESISLAALTSRPTKMATVDLLGRINIWAFPSITLLKSLDPDPSIHSIAITPDENHLITGGNKLLKILDTNSGALVRSIPYPDAARDIAIYPNRSKMVTSGWDKDLQIWTSAISHLSYKQLLVLAALIQRKEQGASIDMKLFPHIATLFDTLPESIKEYIKK